MTLVRVTLAFEGGGATPSWCRATIRGSAR